MTVFPPLHPAPPVRLGTALARTLWTLAGLGPAGAEGGPERLQRWSREVLAALGVRIQLEAPLPAEGQLWVSNHLSWLDPLVYLALRPAFALAKAEVEDYPLLGHGARRAGLRFVDRDDPASRALALRRLARDLAAGRPCLLFPEGTTTRGPGLAPLREGGLGMAHRLGVKLLPLRLACAQPHYAWVGDAALMPHLGNLARQRVTVVRVAPGPVLDPRSVPDRAAWLRLVRAHLDPDLSSGSLHAS